MRHDGDASGGIPVFGVAAPLGDEKETPCRKRTRMTSEEPSRLGIDHLLPNDHFAHGSVGVS